MQEDLWDRNCSRTICTRCRWSLSVGRDDKVHLVPALVAPIEHFPALRARHNFHSVRNAPQRPKVIITQVLPASVVANETGIEAIDFRRSDYLSGPTSAEGANDMSDERCLKNAEVVCDGWPAYLARAGKSSCVKDAGALCMTSSVNRWNESRRSRRKSSWISLAQ